MAMRALPPARLGLWAAAGVGITLGTQAALGAPPPLLATALGLLGYMTYGTLGVFWPEHGMYGRVLWRGPERPELALTFDDGPHPHTTRKVLHALSAAGATATFFLVGRKACQYPELVREIASRGHELGLHGFEHDRLFSLRRPERVLADIRKTQQAIASAGVPEPTLFRPPVGFLSHFTVAGARRAGVTLVGCSARALDGFEHASLERVSRRLQHGLKPGALLALHDAAEKDDFEPASIRALPELLKLAQARQLRTVRLSEWLPAAEGPQPMKGAPSTKLLA